MILSVFSKLSLFYYKQIFMYMCPELDLSPGNSSGISLSHTLLFKNIVIQLLRRKEKPRSYKNILMAITHSYYKLRYIMLKQSSYFATGHI